MLDMYLSPHVNTLYSQIRNRALVQVSGTKSLLQLGEQCDASILQIYRRSQLLSNFGALTDRI